MGLKRFHNGFKTAHCRIEQVLQWDQEGLQKGLRRQQYVIPKVSQFDVGSCCVYNAQAYVAW
jgi:hypothetical protein